MCQGPFSMVTKAPSTRKSILEGSINVSQTASFDPITRQISGSVPRYCNRVATISGLLMGIAPLMLYERQGPAQADKQGEGVRHRLVQPHNVGVHGLQSRTDQGVVAALLGRPGRIRGTRICHDPETVAQASGDHLHCTIRRDIWVALGR